MKFQGLTYDEIVFRVLLAREEARPNLSFDRLEKSLPKKIRHQIEADWRQFISTEELEFDSAFQKAVRKHIPGIYHVVMAAEFLQKIPFHVALAHFLEIQRLPGPLQEDDIFTLAEFFADHIRRLRHPVSPHAPLSSLGAKFQQNEQEPSPSVRYQGPETPQIPTGPIRRCAFCKKYFSAKELYAHIDEQHLNPAHLGTNLPAPLPKPQAAIPEQTTSQIVPSPMFARFRNGLCIAEGCPHIAIPGDFFCYEHATD